MSKKRLTITLAACATLAGCTNATPGPSLASNNPSVRLQAVHQAQNHYGATKILDGIDQNAIVGRWNHPRTESAYIRFNADGTFTDAALLYSTQGTYRFLSNDVIEFTYPGTYFGTNVATREYRLFRNTLELKVRGDWVKYTKAI